MSALLSSLSIGRRIALVIGVLIAALVVVCAVSLVKFQSLTNTVRELSEGQAERIQLSQRWDANIREAVARWQAVALSPDAGLFSEVREATLAISTDTTRVQKRFAEIELSDEGKALGQELGAARTLWLAERDKVRAAIEAGEQDKARELGRSSFADVSKAYLAVSARHAEFQVKRARLEGARAEQAARNQLLLLGGVSSVCLVLSLLLAVSFARSLLRPIEAAVGMAERIAAGDLSVPVQVQGRDEMARLLRAMQSMQSELSQLIGRIGQGADGVATASGEISQGNVDLSQRTERAAAALQQTASSMQELSGSVNETARSAGAARQLAQEAGLTAQAGGDAVAAVVATMDEITGASRRIGEIVGTIDSIAFQTNILALNAAVEAARAGDQGRGFAVVAAEVRALAQRSSAASREIRVLIESSTRCVDEGARQVGAAGQTMGQLVTRVRDVATVISEISEATERQSAGLGQVQTAVTELDRMTQHNSALVEETAAAAGSLGEQAEQLKQHTQRFRVAMSRP
jgi:methyl-accepting chemotaxis protein